MNPAKEAATTISAHSHSHSHSAPENSFGEAIAARSDEASEAMFDPAVVEPTVAFLAAVDRRYGGPRRRRDHLVGRHCRSARSTLWSTQVNFTHPRMTHSQISIRKAPQKRGLEVEPTGIEPVTSCLQS